MIGHPSLRRAVSYRDPRRLQERQHDKIQENLTSRDLSPSNLGIWNQHQELPSRVDRRSSHIHASSSSNSLLTPLHQAWPTHARQLVMAKEQRKALQDDYVRFKMQRNTERLLEIMEEGPRVETSRAINHAERHDYLEAVSPVVTEPFDSSFHGTSLMNEPGEPPTPLTPKILQGVYMAQGQREHDVFVETDTESLYSTDADGGLLGSRQRGIGMVGVPAISLISKASAGWRYGSFPALRGQREHSSHVTRSWSILEQSPNERKIEWPRTMLKSSLVQRSRKKTKCGFGLLGKPGIRLASETDPDAPKALGT